MGRREYGSAAEQGKRKNLLRVFIVVAMLAAIAIGMKITGDKDTDVGFTPLAEDGIPQEITGQILPEYRDMERALACVIDGKVYVLATRGEKPTTGYEISIEKISLTEEKKKQILTVQAQFTDPQAGASLTQEVTYPYVAAETDLKELPDKIQLKIDYAD